MGRSAIRSAADLRGQIIGVISPGASGDVAARACLRSLGVEPKKDVIIGRRQFFRRHACFDDELVTPAPRDAVAADPKEFFDNSLINEISR